MERKSSLLNKYMRLFHKAPDMSKIEHEVVHSGWMTKSPPERKLLGPWKLFRARWKKRYFVLCKPLGSLPGQYELNYFNDEQCHRKKGTIDLDQCEQIIESLDSDQFPYLLAIKTICKGKERTYFLATGTEEDMAKWVSNLCSVCGLKQEDSPTDIPEPKKQVPTQNGKAPVVSATTINPHLKTNMTRMPIVTQPQNTVQSSLSSDLSTSESYIPLQECSTGSRVDKQSQQSTVDRRQSVDSVPDELAPPPPLKIGHPSSPRDSNNVFDELYSVPPSSKNTHISFEPFYLVPPPQGQRNSDSEFHHDLSYDVPRASPSTPRSSSSGCTDSTISGGRPVTPQDLPTYDFPPTHSATVRQSSPPPPIRPPRPMTSAYPQNDYQNLPTSTRGNTDLSAIIPTPSKCERPLTLDSYDVPRSSVATINRESNINIVPAAPKPCNINKGNKHSYINAATGYVPTDDDLYLSMDQGVADPESTYTDMTVSPPTPAPRPPNTLTNNNDLYVSPPSSNHTRPQVVIPRPIPPSTDDAYFIWSNTRTKSFKRHQNGTGQSHSSSLISNSRPSVPNKSISVQLPHHRDGDISSDDEGLAHLHKVCGVQSIPPPPGEDKELKYLDLALEETTDKESVHMKNLPLKNHHVNSPPTEYREIDFIKTQALIITKKWGDNQRQNEKIEKH